VAVVSLLVTGTWLKRTFSTVLTNLGCIVFAWYKMATTRKLSFNDSCIAQSDYIVLSLVRSCRCKTF